MSTLNILCFGDSITDGFPSSHPYGWSLKATLESSLASTTIIPDIQGLPGDMCISPPGSFLPRIEALYEELDTPCDWAVMLGGTNDLTQKQEADPIYSALQKVWSVSLSNNTKVLALTVPECGICNPYLDHKRDALNKMILEHQAENFYTFDLHAAIPFWSMSEEQRKLVWFDGLHLTEKGYDLMGSVIASRLAELLAELEMGKIRYETDSQKLLMARPEMEAKKGSISHKGKGVASEQAASKWSKGIVTKAIKL